MSVQITTVLLSASICLCAIASAEFEKWTDTQGRAAEMEIVGVQGEAEKTEVEFRVRSGKKVMIPLTKLDAVSQLRVASWRKLVPKLTSKFIRIQTEKDLGGLKRMSKNGQAEEIVDPYLNFCFAVHGENIIGIDPQDPAVVSVEVGNQRRFSWKKTYPYRSKVPTRVAVNLQGHGEYKIEDLKAAEFSGSVTVLTSPGPTEVKKEFKLPSKPGEKLSGKVGHLAVVAEWSAEENPFANGAPKTIWVNATGKYLLEVIETNVEIDGVAYGQRVPLSHAGKNAVVKIKTWDKVREVKVTLTKRSDDPGLDIVTDDDI